MAFLVGERKIRRVIAADLSTGKRTWPAALRRIY
jgi:hypothetical protein